MTANHSRCLRVAVISGEDLLSSQQQVKQAITSTDAIELRLDYWKTLEISAISRLRREITLPVIFTLRKHSEGGRCQLSEPARLSLILELGKLQPEYMDLEHDVPTEWLDKFRRQFPQIEIIGSYHNFHETPTDLEGLWRSLQHPQFDILKIATLAQNICDTLRLLIFLKSISREHRATLIAMGEDGQISRILAPVAGSCFTYGYVANDTASAPGQLSLSTLTDIYRLPELNQDTGIYALIGDPVSQSPGHLVHNRAFALLGKNAVYVKCRVPPEQLHLAMPLFRQLPFLGFSVTIPHKESIVTSVDDLFAEAADLRIVNTIKRENTHYQGFNTDAPGCVSVLEEISSLKKQRCLILGAGGSAKAIAYSLLKKNALVTLCNRTLARATGFTEKFGGKSIDFNALFTSAEFPYDIIINTLPGAAFAQQCFAWKIPPTNNGIAMDIVLKPLETAFIQAAKAAGWRCITGDALFSAQALGQLKIWFNSDMPLSVLQLLSQVRLL